MCGDELLRSMDSFMCHFRTAIFLFSVVVMSFSVKAQSDSLKISYDHLMDKSEDYKQYKVIVREDLASVWNEVQETVMQYQAQLSQERRNVINLKQEVASQKKEVTALMEQVTVLTDQIEFISFFGIDLSKGFYHTLVWGIVILLGISIAFIYGMILRSRKVAKSISADFRILQKEYEGFKERARTREVKVKRELQTAVNHLEEFKRVVKK